MTPRYFFRQRARRLALILGTLFVLIHGYGLVLKFMPVPGTLNMSQRSETIKYDWVPLEEMSPYLAYAVIGAEDSRFCSHHGIDWKAIEKVLDEREAGKTRRGGSSITQQVAKNVYLWNGGGWARKVPETWLALYLDAIWSKRRIMEVYLNIAEWGDGIFGAEAAARARFGKSAKDLTAREAALLASVLPSPNKWRVDPPGDYVKRRAKTLMTRTADVKWGGYGTCTQVDESRMRFAAPPKAKEKPEVKPIEKPDEPPEETPDTEPPEVESPEVEPLETEPEEFETLLDDLQTSVEKTREPQDENTEQENIEEEIDDTPPERL